MVKFMYLRTLRLTQKDGKILRKIDFHLGTNFIVDKEASTNHNHVGKTTFLKLIDIALGSKDKKYLYTDAQTGTTNTDLKQLINEKKISVELDLCQDFEKKKAHPSFNLKVELFDKGHKYINDKKLKSEEYNKELNKKLFNNSNNDPSFRYLIPFFVRVTAKQDNYNFLKNLHANTKNIMYRRIYNYLFDIPNLGNLKELENKKETLNQIRKSESAYKRLINNQPNDVLEQKIDFNKARSKQLQKQINDLVKGTDFIQNREKILQARNKYQDLKRNIDELQYQQKIISKDIQNVNESNPEVNDKLTKELFDEVGKLLPEVNKDYVELIAFNNALKNNRLNYLNNLMADIKNEEIHLIENLQGFLEENKNNIGLIKNNDIAEYDNLTDELSKINTNIAKQEETLETLNEYSKEIDRLSTEISISQETDVVNYKENLNKFNSYFTKLVSEIYNKEPILVYHENLKEFPVSIEDLDEGTSSGSLKSLILCYDIAYQKFAQSIGKVVPNFIVHDVLETIEGDVLLKLINEINSSHIQVIIAILKEKLDSSKVDTKVQDRCTILTLSNNDRVFDPKLDDKI